VGSAGNSFWGGSIWAGYAAWADYFNEVLSISIDRNYLDLVESCGYYWLLDGICFASERPSTINLDERGRLHSERGMSISYPSGWGLWHWHGVSVDRAIIETPESITVQHIDACGNAEQRRVMIERFGTAQYLKDSGAKVVQELPANYYVKGLQTARLLIKDRKDDTPIVMLDVLNSTPEPDGTTKRYMLRIQPDAYAGLASKDCHAAIASTWRNLDNSLYFKKPQDYRPGFES